MLRRTDSLAAVSGKPLVLLVLLATAGAAPGTAQVGHRPATSPYRDIPHHSGTQVDVSYLTGGEGTAGVGLTNAVVAGLHFERPLGKMWRGLLGVAYLKGERTVLDPGAPPESRRLGPETDEAWLFEAEIQAFITGEKSWHGFAPFITTTAGLAYSASEPAQEAAGYKFGTKVFFAPGAGFRWYLASRLSLRTDFRLLFWRLKYPAQYYVSIQDQPPVLDLAVNENEWTRHPTLRLALGWTF